MKMYFTRIASNYSIIKHAASNKEFSFQINFSKTEGQQQQESSHIYTKQFVKVVYPGYYGA